MTLPIGEDNGLYTVRWWDVEPRYVRTETEENVRRTFMSCTAIITIYCRSLIKGIRTNWAPKFHFVLTKANGSSGLVGVVTV